MRWCLLILTVIRHIVFVFCVVAVWACSKLDEEISCSTLSVTVKRKTDPTLCSPSNGSVRVYALGGNPPYSFKINSAGAQMDSLFSNLSGGIYQIEVTDAAQCTSSTEVSLTNFNTDLTASVETTQNTDCLGGNGSAQFIPSGGVPPYQLKVQNIVIENEMEVSGLRHGLFQAVIVDAQQCEFVLSVNIPKGKTAISWAADIKQIIDTRCAKSTCHVPGTGRADFTKFNTVQELAFQIKTKTQNKSMPFDEPMPDSQIQLIACWVDDGALNN